MNVYKALHLEKISRTGSTRPWFVEILVENENSQNYVAKVFKTQTLTQYNAVAHEVIANELAKLLDLSVPEKAFIEFGETFINNLPPKQKDLITSSFIDKRLKFGTVEIMNSKTFMSSQIPTYLEEYEYEDIYAFDNLIYNGDRRISKPNILFKKDDYYLIDHELSFEGISENSISDIESNNWKYQYQRHIFYPILQHRKNKNRLFENFEYSLTQLNINELEKIFKVLATYGYSYENEGIFLNYLHYIQANYRKFVTILKGQIS